MNPEVLSLLKDKTIMIDTFVSDERNDYGVSFDLDHFYLALAKVLPHGDLLRIIMIMITLAVSLSHWETSKHSQVTEAMQKISRLKFEVR